MKVTAVHAQPIMPPIEKFVVEFSWDEAEHLAAFLHRNEFGPTQGRLSGKLRDAGMPQPEVGIDKLRISAFSD